jgi:hypothetical protein
MVYWRYLINARVVCKSKEEIKNFKIPSRVAKEVPVSFDLPYLPKGELNCQQFSFNLMANGPQEQKLLNTACKVVPKSSESGRVELMLRFLSYRPFSTPFDF